jgi:hypothetical protein
LRMDPIGAYFTFVYPKLYALFGLHPKMWDAAV